MHGGEQHPNSKQRYVKLNAVGGAVYVYIYIKCGDDGYV